MNVLHNEDFLVWWLMWKFFSDIPWGIQLAAVYALCDLSPSNPAEISKILEAWRTETSRRIPSAVLSSLEEVSTLCTEERGWRPRAVPGEVPSRCPSGDRSSASRVQTGVPERDVREMQVLGVEEEAGAAFPKPHTFHLWLLWSHDMDCNLLCLGQTTETWT